MTAFAFNRDGFTHAPFFTDGDQPVTVCGFDDGCPPAYRESDTPGYDALRAANESRYPATPPVSHTEKIINAASDLMVALRDVSWVTDSDNRDTMLDTLNDLAYVIGNARTLNDAADTLSQW